MARLCAWIGASLVTLSSLGCGGSDSSDPLGPSSGAGASGATTVGAGAAGSGGSSSGSTSASTGASSGATGGGGGGSGGGNNGFPAHWIDGTNCGADPEVQVWEYDADTFILRQSGCTNFEAPFLYLIFGDAKVLLQDTGTGGADVQTVVQGIIDQWLAKKGKASIELEVTHSHSHGDHVGGDSQFQGKPNTVVVGTSTSAVQTFFGIGAWPTEIAQYDLGGRILDIIPIPGHQTQHIAVYDRRDDLLLTGDTLYPGRLYISSWSAYQASIPRMVDFVNAGNTVEWVLGTHIEMTTTPKEDYPMGSTKHLNEHVLQLEYGVLLELDQAVKAQGASPSYEEHDDFILYP